ncbi:hypothetical protein NEIRO03_0027 [Nematocida sp. AWRm78]|nr:hypothetical protein NEIRO02_0158 [Nematocida sp. AWRm79]KAI5182343.1 hypothetical protein NEIRO03_0027 [Nematocida sp. AWRm78]
MPENHRQLENALKKIRVDFPEILQEGYIPGPVIQKISMSEKKSEEFEDAYQMLFAGIESLITENTGPLKNSAIKYHQVHKEVNTAAKNISEIEAHLSTLISTVKSNNIGKYIDSLKEEQAQYKKDLEESEIKQALAVDIISISDIHAGRLNEIMNNIQYVEEKAVQSEIKYYTENSLWKAKKEIETRIKDSLHGIIRISSMDIRVLEKIAGCALVAVYNSVNERMVKIINGVSKEMQVAMHKKKVINGEDESQILSRGLAQFTSEVTALLHNVQSILHKRQENCARNKKYRYNTDLYEEIKLNRSSPKRMAQITLPLYDSSVTEKDLFDKIVDWIRRFLVELTKEAVNTAEDTMAYNIQRITRLDSANLMYNELFQNKYGFLANKEKQAGGDLLLMNVHLVRSEESILIVHGCALQIAAVVRDVLADVLPTHVNISEKIRGIEPSNCFKNRKKILMDLVTRVTELENTADHTTPFLQKYQRSVQRVIMTLGKFIKTSIAGLEIKVEEMAEEVLEKLLQSMKRVFKTISKVPDIDINNISYHKDSSISVEIERWNHPLNKECAFGQSIFTNCTSRKFIAISEFIHLPEEVLVLISQIPTIKEKEIKPEEKSEIKPEENSDPEKTTKSKIEILQSEFTQVSGEIFGCFTVHLLSLVKASLDQLLIKGDILDRKLEHFLLLDIYFIQKTRNIMIEYITTYFILHIDKFAIYTGTSTFKQAVLSLQHSLERKEVKNDLRDAKYLPVHVFYILPYLEKKDRLFGTGLLGIYKQNRLISQKIREIFGISADIL